MRRTALALMIAALGLATLLGGCRKERKFLEIGIPAHGDETFMELNPVDDMHDQAHLKAQEEESMMPAPLTVPRTHIAYPEAVRQDKNLAKALTNPVAIDKESLLRGQDLYMTYCVVCHDERGLGNGTIIPKFSKPPALTSRKLRAATDGELYHIISNGQNVMPSYANQLKPMERWAVVNYLRALQRAENPTAADVQRLPQQ